VQPRQPGTVSLNEALAVSTDDVGHLEGWLTHFVFLPGPLHLVRSGDFDGVQRVAG